MRKNEQDRKPEAENEPRRTKTQKREPKKRQEKHQLHREKTTAENHPHIISMSNGDGSSFLGNNHETGEMFNSNFICVCSVQ